MAYSEKQMNSVFELIDKYTENTLDRYSSNNIKEKAKEAMEEGKDSIKVADAVYDYVYNFHSGNIVMSTICKQIFPKGMLIILRNEIIKVLK